MIISLNNMDTRMLTSWSWVHSTHSTDLICCALVCCSKLVEDSEAISGGTRKDVRERRKDQLQFHWSSGRLEDAGSDIAVGLATVSLRACSMTDPSVLEIRG